MAAVPPSDEVIQAEAHDLDVLIRALERLAVKATVTGHYAPLADALNGLPTRTLTALIGFMLLDRVKAS